MSNQKPLGAERKAIYDYLESVGFTITSDIYTKLRSLLKAYANAKTQDLQDRINEINNRLQKYEDNPTASQKDSA